MKLPRPALAVAALVLATGCADHQVAGTPAPPTAHGSEYRTVDVCSFLTKDAFDAVLPHAGGEVNYSDYSNCQLTITGTQHKTAISWDVQLDASLDFDDAGKLSDLFRMPISRKSVLGSVVFEGAGTDAGCIRAFHIPFTAATLMITVKGKSLQCPEADAALMSALKTVKKHKAEHYKIPEGSIGRADLCAAFQVAAKQALGADPAAAPEGLHGCNWTAPGATIAARLTAEKWPPYSVGPDAARSTVAGHRILLSGSAPSAEGVVDLGRGSVGMPGTIDVIDISSNGAKGNMVQVTREFAEVIARSRS